MKKSELSLQYKDLYNIRKKTKDKCLILKYVLYFAMSAYKIT